MPNYIDLLCLMVDAKDPAIEGLTWDEFQREAAQHLFDALDMEDFSWGVH